ncbi:sensor domain-containing diguanylate cyclase [Methylosarcina fibrata]|uniref:sensor domain-containing diguanylate cyclase n=1 Tax=Methylosarcina fibrata TaxID=105972 RepID=UPI00035F2E50|nr:GGDEF domain-containing protein [Methylosarcina fibrata]
MIDIQRYIAEKGLIAELPTITLKVLEIINQESATLNDLAEVIKVSPSLTTKILQVANSSYFSINGQVSSVDRAVAVLGLKAVATLALSISLLSEISKSKGSQELYQRWERSFFTAVAARLLAEKRGVPEQEECFVSGLLTDISYMFLYRHFPEEYNALMQPGISETDRLSLEMEYFGLTHAEISALLLRQARIPPLLIKPVEYHHTQHIPTKAYEPSTLLMCQVVYAAAGITALFYQDTKTGCTLKQELEEILELPPKDIDHIFVSISSKVKEVAELFGFHPDNFPSYFDILQKVNEKLVSINLSYEELLRHLKEEKEKTDRLATKLEEANRKLLEIALKDPLTGVYNRRFLYEMVDKRMADARRNQRPLSIIAGDIDHFKRVNDTYGHGIGDTVLKKTALLMSDCLRTGDILARTGGEEFIVVCQVANAQAGALIAERIRSRLEQTPIRLNDGRTIQVTMSFGVAMFEPHFQSREDFINLADERLYSAKRAGRNRVHAGT